MLDFITSQIQKQETVYISRDQFYVLLTYSTTIIQNIYSECIRQCQQLNVM